MLVVMLIGDVLLIPDHGLAGAAWATVIGELVGFTLYAPMAIDELRRHRKATSGSPPDVVILGDV
jgi:Na+-driven multidrug efflux pump